MKRNQRPGKGAAPVVGPAKLTTGWAVLILGIVVLLAYSNSFRAGLIFDNAVLFTQDARIHAFTSHNLFLILTKGYWLNRPEAGLYRPFTTFSFLLNYVAFGNGAQPASYHWVNLALHEINVLLVYALGLLIFDRRAPSVALAALWGLHPLHTEAVTNVVGRADLLAAFGVLAGVLCFAAYSRAVGRRKFWWLAGLAGAQAIGIFSKESAAILPGVLLVYEWTSGQAASWQRRAVPYAAVMLPLAAYLWLRGSLAIHLLPNPIDNPIVGAAFLAGRMTAVEVLGKFLWLFFWPARLSADYSYQAIPALDLGRSSGKDVVDILTAGILLAVTWLAVAKRQTAKAPCFFTLFFWIAYLPTSNLPILIGSIMAERFLYLPSIGLAGLAVAAVARWRPSVGLHLPESAWWGVTAAICLALGARTYIRNLDWLDDYSLWTSTVAVSPESARAHNNLGLALPLPDRLPDAIAEFEAALRIRPDDGEAHNNLGNALAHMPGRLPEAIAEFQAVVRISPDYAEGRDNLGSALLQSGRRPEAVSEFQAALRIRPDYPEAHYNLGTALLEMPGRLDDAIGEFQAALRIRPDYADAHNNLGIALLELPDRLPDAIAEFQAAVAIRPGYAEAHNNLGRMYLRVPGRLTDAIAQFEAALRGRPNFAEAHFNLGNALLHTPGRLEDAADQYEAALRLDPDVPEGHYNLANVLLQVPGRTPDAIAEFEKALRLKPDFAEAHYNLAMVLRRIPGREAAASKELAIALRIRPGLGK